MISVLASCWAYAEGVILPMGFLRLSSLYSRRPRLISVHACSSVGNQCSLRHSSRSRPLTIRHKRFDLACQAGSAATAHCTHAPKASFMIKPAERKDLEIAGAALRGFTQIARAWRLTDEKQSAVLGTPPAVASAQLDAGQVDACWPRIIERISYVLGIYAAPHTIFPNRQQEDDGIRRPNT